MNQSIRLVVAAALMVGCAGEASVGEEIETQVFAGRGPPHHQICPSEGCGTNSPDVDVALDLRGRVDDAPYWFAGAYIETPGARQPADFAVAGDGIQIAGDPILFRYIEENPWTDTRLVLVIKRDTGAEYELRLKASGGADYLASPYGWVHAYLFTVKKTVQGSEAPGLPLGTSSPLCLGAASDPDVGAPAGESWAVVFSGDRYDRDRKRVLPSESTRFHIACEDSASAKMLLYRHTEAGSVAPAQAVTLAQRQTLLKLLTGDHCGDGRSFTTAGQLLDFAVANDSWKGIPGRGRIDLDRTEAIWGPEGAVCLNEPRAGTRDAIAAHCATLGKVLPRCTPAQTQWEDWKAFGHAVSVHLTAP